MSGLVSHHDPRDYTELIEGELSAEEIEATERDLGNVRGWVPREEVKEIKAGCLLCPTKIPMGRYRYDSDPISLPDGSITTALDWDRQVDNSRLRKPKRYRLYCPNCGFPTDHVAERPK